jgi:phosphoglycerol transferase MdoB-like AlkP superfamily enzyme
MKIQNTLKSWSLDVYLMTIYRLLIILFIFTLLRVAFYFFNQSFFPDLSISRFTTILFGGLRFDLVAILYTNALFIAMNIIPFPFRYNQLYQKIAKWIFIVTNTIIILVNCIDFVYFRFTARRTTATVFREFENETNMGSLVGRFIIDYWYLLIIAGLMVYLLIKLYGKQLSKPTGMANLWAYYPTAIVLMGLSAGLFIAGVRGGFAHSTRPITLSNAGEYIEKPLELSLVLNTPFAIYKTLGIESLKKVHFFTNEAELNAQFTPVHKAQNQQPFKPDNVVIIIIESFGKEYMGCFNGHLQNGSYKGYTPFMDSLITQSKTFKYSFANGKKSIDAMPSVLASIPSIVEPYVLTPYSGNKINSMANLLKTKGYSSAFFHGAPNGSMGFLAFSKLAGFDSYYGKTEYGKDEDFDGMWGIWDEEFLGYYADEMNKMKQPFFTSVFTVSSHHPFEVPAKYKGKFPDGNLRIHKCIGYTDMALKRFFQKASQMPWFKNTLFVITADHTSADSYFQEYQTNAGIFSIPIVFYKPGSDLKGMEDRLVQQNDIMPTVLNYLNFDKDYVAFGNDAFDKTIDPFVVNYNNGVYQIFMDDYLLQFDGQKPIALYNFKTDTFLSNNVMSKNPEVEIKMENKIKAFIQQYNKRLIEDDLLAK